MIQIIQNSNAVGLENDINILITIDYTNLHLAI